MVKLFSRFFKGRAFSDALHQWREGMIERAIIDYVINGGRSVDYNLDAWMANRSPEEFRSFVSGVTEIMRKYPEEWRREERCRRDRIMRLTYGS